jgi:hypothetical protein
MTIKASRAGALARPACFTFLALLPLMGVLACSSDDHETTRTADQHAVYFTGYLYDGATSTRLKPEQIGAMSIKYRDKIVRTTIEADGRFITIDPLPTWQDYAVYIGAPGYRPFVSRNPGIDVPKSLAMTDGLATTATTQTFNIDAYLFPSSLKAGAVALNIEKSDAAILTPAPARAMGTIRLRPESASVLDRASFDNTGATIATTARRWANDEDLLNQTVIKPIVEGAVDIAEGELAYGVPYQIAIFDVKGYQPVVLSGAMALVGGSVSSRTVMLPKELQDPLRVLSTNADTCMPPASLASDYGAVIQITLNTDAEFVGSNYAEDIDNGLVVYPNSNSGNSSYCPLKTSLDPAKQEHGSRVTLDKRVLSLAFNPSLGYATMSSFGGVCMIPPAITSVVYGNLQLINLQPVGDPSRKRNLASMLLENMGSTGTFNGALSCPGRTGSAPF